MKKAKLWNNIYLLTAVFFTAFILAFPTVPVKFSIWKFKVDTVLAGPNIDVSLFGKTFQKQFDSKLGLSLGGGYRVTLTADLSSIDEANRDSVFTEVESQLLNRSYLLGLQDFQIRKEKTADSYKIYIDIGKYENFQNVMLVFTEGNISFKQLKAENKNENYTNISSNSESYEDTALTAGDLDYVKYLLTTDGSDAIQFVFTQEGLSKFAEVAKANVGYPVAIMMDGSILSAPTISEDFVAGEISNPVISGGLSGEYTKSLVKLLNSGSLKTSVEVENSELVDSLVSRNLQVRAFYGALIGLAVLCVLSIVIYRNLGVLLSIALGFNTVLIVALSKFGFPTVLSWVFGSKLGDLIFQPVTVTIPVLIGLLASTIIFILFHFRIFTKLKLLAKENKISEESKTEMLKDNFKFVLKITVFVSVIAIVIGWFGFGAFTGFGLGLGLTIITSLFTYWALSQTLIHLFHTLKAE